MPIKKRADRTPPLFSSFKTIERKSHKKNDNSGTITSNLKDELGETYERFTDNNEKIGNHDIKSKYIGKLLNFGNSISP